MDWEALLHLSSRLGAAKQTTQSWVDAGKQFQDQKRMVMPNAWHHLRLLLQTTQSQILASQAVSRPKQKGKVSPTKDRPQVSSAKHQQLTLQGTPNCMHTIVAAFTEATVAACPFCTTHAEGRNSTEATAAACLFRTTNAKGSNFTEATVAACLFCTTNAKDYLECEGGIMLKRTCGNSRAMMPHNKPPKGADTMRGMGLKVVSAMRTPSYSSTAAAAQPTPRAPNCKCHAIFLAHEQGVWLLVAVSTPSYSNLWQQHSPLPEHPIANAIQYP
eukprot:1144977-Pelagomonas_calceolata.AAC.2